MKKRSIFLLLVGLVACIGFIWSPRSDAGQEKALTPIQKAMQARAGWLTSMTENLDAMKFKKVRADAKSLASQTGTIAKKIANPEAKELTLKLSGLATELASAASKKDAETAKTKLAEIKATCGQCHAKFRDHK